MELEFYIPKLGLIPRCIRPVRPVADLYDLFGKEAVATTDANPRARGPRTTRPRPGPGRAKPTAADDNHPGPPDPADTARVPTNAQRAIVARWPGPGVGGEELG